MYVLYLYMYICVLYLQMYMYVYIIYTYIHFFKENEKKPPFQHPMTTGLGRGGARASPPRRRCGSKRQALILGSLAKRCQCTWPLGCPSCQGTGMQLHQSEAGEGVLSLDLSALGQC